MTNDGIISPEKVSYDFRKNIAASMVRAAKEAGLTIHTDQIAITTRGDTLVANAIIDIGDERPEIQENLSFLYLSFSKEEEIASVIPNGFYTLRANKTMNTTENLRAELVASDGRVVKDFPLNREIEAVDASSGNPVGRPIVYAEASITQSPVANRARLVITAHGTICYENVWYWIWVVITLG